MKKIFVALILLSIFSLVGCSLTRTTNEVTSSPTTKQAETTKQIETTKKPTTKEITTVEITTNTTKVVTTTKEEQVKAPEIKVKTYTRSEACPVGIEEEYDGWIPTFCEEFDYEGKPDPNIWNYQTGGGGWGNNESQYYTNRLDNAYVQNGILTILAKKENYSGYEYTSARINTSNKADTKYGKIEVRAKLPSVGGTWPAIWMMPTKSVYGGWPKSGEIDIMEATGNAGSQIMGTVHTGKYYWANNNQVGSGYRALSSTISTEYHTYGIEWYPDEIKWLFDGVEYFTTKGSKLTSISNNLDVEPYMAWPFDQDFHLILNIAIGGNMGGNIASNFTSDKMEVDYVRFFQRNYSEIDSGDAPTAVKNIRLLKATVAGTYFSWGTSSDDTRVMGYNVFVDNKFHSFVQMNYVKIDRLSDGKHTIAIEAIDYASNISIRMEKTFNIQTRPIVPGVVEAEDATSISGSAKTETCTDVGGGYNLGYIVAGDILNYSVHFSEGGSFKIKYRIASESATGKIEVQVGGTVIGQITLSPTGGWQTWRDVVGTPFIIDEECDRLIKITVISGDFNLNYFEVIED